MGTNAYMIKECSGGAGLAIGWSRFVVPRALWCLYELLQESAAVPSPSPERVMFLFLCNRALSIEAMCTGKEDLSWKLDSYPWAVQDRLALCYMSNESLPWSEPSLCCTFLALLHISMNQCIKTFMYKCDPISIIFPGPKQRDFVINIFSNFGN